MSEIKLPPVPEGMCLPEDIEDYAREAVRLNIPDGWKLVPVEPTEEWCRSESMPHHTAPLTCTTKVSGGGAFPPSA